MEERRVDVMKEFKLGQALSNDEELIRLVHTRMRFKKDPFLDEKSKLELINQFRMDYENTDQDTVTWAPEFAVVVRRIIDGYRPKRLYYLTDFEGEDVQAREEHREEGSVIESEELYVLLHKVMAPQHVPLIYEIRNWSVHQRTEATFWANSIKTRNEVGDGDVLPWPSFIRR